MGELHDMTTTNKWMSMFCKDEKNIIASETLPRERVITKSPSLNWALNGGFCKGYTTVLYGPEGSGKSLTSMLAVAALHQSDPEALAMLISTEMREVSPNRLRILGVDPERLIIRHANTVHDVFDYIASMDVTFKNSDGSKSGAGLSYALHEGAPIQGLIIDSIKGIRGPKEQDAKSSEDTIMGDLSKYLNGSLRLILPIIRKYNLMTIFVQQVNMNMNPDEVKYQNKKWTIPSGQALKHFAETMALIEQVTKKDSKIFDEELKSIRQLPVQQGHTIRVRVDKANLDRPFREAEFQIHYDKGVVNTALEVAMLATNLGVVRHPLTDKGTENRLMWEYKDQKWKGINGVIDALESSPELQREVMADVITMDFRSVED